MTVVLDTNVLVAAMVAKGLCHEVVVRAFGGCMVATSAALIDELERTLQAKFTVGPPTAAFISQFRAHARLVIPQPLPAAVSRDPDDDVVIATAVAAHASVIVTGDQDPLVLGAYQGVAIVTPREFLARIAG